MDPIATGAFTPKVKASILAALAIPETDLEDLGGFESFIFLKHSTQTIIRMTHISHRDESQILGEMEFIDHLLGAGGSVCRPIPFKDGSLVLTLGEFVMSQFERAQGDIVSKENWNHVLFTTWGRDIAQFHLSAQSFLAPKHKRPEWDEDENLHFTRRIPSAQQLVQERARQCMMDVAKLIKNEGNYGLIHCDAHYKNFFYQSGRLTFFDFDDCCYQWFVFDVATILFGIVFMEGVENTRKAQEQAASDFLPAFLAGYKEVVPVTPFLLEQLPLFLKLRELSLYAAIHAHGEIDNLTDWFPKKVMVDRQRRIEAGEVFLDMDFMQL